MDQLSIEQHEEVRKTNTERLRLMAAKTGEVEDEELETMDRTAFLAIVIKDTLARKRMEKGAIAGKASERRIDTARELELQLELKKLELENRRAEIEVENRMKERERVREKTDGVGGG